MGIPNKNVVTVSGTLGFVLYICRIFAVAPLRLKRIKNGWRIRVSRSATLYGRFILLFICLSHVFFMILNLCTISEYTFHFVDVFDAVKMVPASIMMLQEAFGGSQRMQGLITCLAQIQKINIELSHYKAKVPFVQMERAMAGCSLGTATIVYIISLHHHFHDFMDRNEKIIFAITQVIYLCKFIILKVLLLQINLIHKIVQRSFNHFNDCLQSSIERKCIDCNEFSRKVYHFGYLYCSLSNIVQRINCSHGIFLASALVYYLPEFIVIFYHLVVLWQLKNYLKVFTVLLLSMINCTVDLITIIESCHRTHIQINRTKHLISQLLRVTPLERHELTPELQLFYNQLMANEPVFAPLNMFKLERSIFVTIFASVLTCLVVSTPSNRPVKKENKND